MSTTQSPIAAAFEQASRKRLRFTTVKGVLSTEDLWDLPLTSGAGKANLDDLAKDLHREVKAANEEVSFVSPTASVAVSAETQLRFEIVKHIIGVRVAERDSVAQAKARTEKKQNIMALIERKKSEQLEGQSLADLEKMLNDL